MGRRMPEVPCRNCQRPGVPLCAHGRCQTCQRYWRRHHTEHPLPLRSHLVHTGGCIVCGGPDAHRRGRCRRCYMYWWTNGRERPASVAGKHTIRPCRIPGCPRHYRQAERGLCHRHYMQWYRGHITLEGRRRTPKGAPVPVTPAPERLGCPTCRRVLVAGRCPQACGA